MGTEVINISFDVLQEELEKAKSNLKGLNDNIRRISGREPPDQLRLVVVLFFFLHIFLFVESLPSNLFINFFQQGRSQTTD